MQTGTQEITITYEEKCIHCEGDQILKQMPREVMGSSSLKNWAGQSPAPPDLLAPALSKGVGPKLFCVSVTKQSYYI